MSGGAEEVSEPVGERPSGVDRQTVAVIVLAAGASSRFGGAKQLADFGGRPLLQRAVTAAQASSAGGVLVVVDPSAVEVAASLEGLDVRVVENPQASQGQGTSVRRGIEALAAEVTAVVFVNADQPFVDAGVIDGLIDRWDGDRESIVVAAFEGRRGSPALFGAASFEALRSLEGDEGGRSLIAGSKRVTEFEVDREAVLLDADTPEELEQLRNST